MDRTRSRDRRARVTSRLLGTALAAVAVLVAPTAVVATEPPVTLRVTPAGQAPGTYFRLSLRGGETRRVSVDLANTGDRPITARTYAADVYTTINGGFGARLRDAQRSGPTLWVRYPTAILELAGRSTSRRTVSIAVPAGTTPGEYITSVVLENEDVIAGSGPIAVDQIIRQAVAIAVTVPGPARPALVVGEATHGIVGGRSVVGVALRNTGNRHLRPVGSLVLRDDSGREVTRAPLAMDRFYAVTDTRLEVPLETLLLPGTYALALELQDPAYGVSVRADTVPMTVAAPATDAVSPAPSGGAPDTATKSPGGGSVPLGLGIGALLATLFAGGLLGLLALVLARRRSRTTR